MGWWFSGLLLVWVLAELSTCFFGWPPVGFCERPG